MAVFINGDPVDRLARLVRPIGVAFVVLHVDGVVVSLRKATSDRLHDPEKPVEKRRAKERVVNEVVTDAVDVCVDHQRINEAEDQHHPQRGARIKEEERKKVSEMKQAGQRRDRVPPRVGEDFRGRGDAFNADGIGFHEVW